MQVFVFAPLWGLCSASPFCVKLETWLRMAKIPYESVPLTSRPKSRSGKVPYVVFEDGTLIADSGTIIDELTRKRDVQLDAGLSAEERVASHLIRRTLEESFYFYGLWTRWGVDAHWAVIRRDYFANMPVLVRWLVPPLARRQVLRDARGQGVSRHSAEEQLRRATADVEAVAATLGSDDYFFGRPSTTDAIVYGFIANTLAAPIADPLKSVIESTPLLGHAERMRARYW